MLSFSFISAWDTVLLAKIAALHSESATLFFLALTYLGEWYVAAFIMFLCLIAFLYYKQYFLVLPFLFATGGATATTAFLKTIVMRPRPELGLVAEHSFSFPSGHATIAVALYGFIAWYLYRSEHLPGPLAGKAETKHRTRTDVPLIIILIFLIAFSRLYLVTHYPSDVLAGMFVGGIFLFIAVSTVNILIRDDRYRLKSFRLEKDQK